ncbi:MAG: hypothetical protein Q8N53_05300 [Longimicrobiales bacterium]|nr:hypothetical protein [Longimicrobiales bacterium]
MRTTFHLAMLLLVAPTAACYTYSEGSFTSVAPGSEIRVEVTRQTALRFQEALAGDYRSLEGTVKSWDGASMMLDVVSTTRQTGFQFEPLRQTLQLEPADVAYVEMKTFNRNRSIVALSLAGVAAGAVAWKALGGKTGGDTRPPTGGGPADARIVRPGFRVPLPFP